MDYLYLMILSLILFAIGFGIEKLTKFPMTITYILIGILLGGMGLAYLNESFYIIENPKYFPHVSRYSSLALYFMFCAAGVGIKLVPDKNKNKQKDITTIKLSIFPILVAVVVASTLFFLTFNYAIDSIWKITLIETLFIFSTLAMAQPANVIPSTLIHVNEGRFGKNGIANNVINAATLDNLVSVPILLVSLTLIVGDKLGLGKTIPTVLLNSIILMIVVIVLGLLVGALYGLVVKQLFKKFVGIKYIDFIVAVLTFIVMVGSIILLSKVKLFAGGLNLYGMLYALLFGSGIRVSLPEDKVNGFRTSIMILFAVFGLPIIFAGVGATVNLKILKDANLVFLSILFIIITVIVKGLVTKSILKKDYTKNEVKYAVSAFIPIGKATINFLVLFAALLPLQIVTIMTFLSTLAVVITMPIGIYLMEKKGKKWLVKEEVNNE